MMLNCREIPRILGTLLLGCQGENDAELTALCTDSRKVVPGALFIALPGTKSDGSTFIASAVASGAAAVLRERGTPPPPGVVSFLVSDARKAASLLYRAVNGEPDKALKIFGVTGTNGKTTSAYLLRHLLNHCGLPCGLVSTVEYDDGKNVLPPTHTTPDPWTLFPLFSAMRSNHLQAAAMEFSSHSLAQHRIDGIQVAAAIFTNLTGDHLDFHHDMANYFAAKQRLFLELLVSGGIAAVNLDDPYGAELASIIAAKRPDVALASFGTAAGARYHICDVESDADGSRFTFGGMKIVSPLTGSYNVHNLAGVLAALLCFGIAPEQIQTALAKPFQVPGRLQLLRAPNGARFYVDYAHTDDALANVLTTLRPCCRGCLTVLFGAGGDRDRTKRPRMGAVAAKLADRVILTSDNPRSESPLAIIDEICSGIPAGAGVTIEADRRKALRLAVSKAQPEDVVLVAGKGHEDYQEIGGVRHHFSDAEELTALFQEKM